MLTKIEIIKSKVELCERLVCTFYTVLESIVKRTLAHREHLSRLNCIVRLHINFKGPKKYLRSLEFNEDLRIQLTIKLTYYYFNNMIKNE